MNEIQLSDFCPRAVSLQRTTPHLFRDVQWCDVDDMSLRLALLLSATTVVLLSSSPANSADTGLSTFAFEAPKGVTASEVFALIAHGEDQRLATLIGLQRWPQKEDTYVGIVCLAPDQKHFDEDKEYCNGSPCCTAGYGGFNEAKDPRRVFIGVVEYKESLRLVASPGGPLKVRTTWQQSNIDPNGIEKDEGAYPGSYKGFDFAPYQVSKDQVAFGIRVAWQTMYGGGGGTFTALMLFLVQGNRIVNVLSEPIGEWGMSGNGPEEKSVWSTENILRILPQKHSGYFDVQLKERRGKWKRTLQWDAKANRYLPLPQ